MIALGNRMPMRHYDDVIIDSIPSQITSLTNVYSTVHSGTDQRKHQSSASLAFVWEIHRLPVNFPHKWPVTRKMFPFDDVIMMSKPATKDGETYLSCEIKTVYLKIWSKARVGEAWYRTIGLYYMGPPFFLPKIPQIGEWMNKHGNCFIRNVIRYPSRNFNGSLNLTVVEIRQWWVITYHLYMWDVITPPCPNLNGDLSKFRAWMSNYTHCVMWMKLLIHAQHWILVQPISFIIRRQRMYTCWWINSGEPVEVMHKG